MVEEFAGGLGGAVSKDLFIGWWFGVHIVRNVYLFVIQGVLRR